MSPSEAEFRSAGSSVGHPIKCRRTQRTFGRAGLAQLSLVEHALCSLDTAKSLVRDYHRETGYYYTDQNRKRSFAHVHIAAPLGLSPSDEFLLWGLLALTFEQRNPSIEFWATPHFCLRRLGCLDAKGADGGQSKGGENYAAFRASVERLAAVLYQCDAFYDPLRREYRRRGFGFLKYDLPHDSTSSRAWRIVWDPLFFEFCQATGGKLFFDLGQYRGLDYATRRLYLLLHKMFWRIPRSPTFDVEHLMVHVLGFSPTVRMPQLKQKLCRSIERLLNLGFLQLPAGVLTPHDLIEKERKGVYRVRFWRGPYFEVPPSKRSTARTTDSLDSPLAEPLRAIGFTDQQVRRIAKKYSRKLIELWSDVTLAKLERDGTQAFRVSPQAFFIDNLKHAARKERTVPDWYRELKRSEHSRRTNAGVIQVPTDEEVESAYRKARSEAFRRHVKEKISRNDYKQAVEMFLAVHSATMPGADATEAAIADAERHFEAGFEFPQLDAWRRDQEPL